MIARAYRRPHNNVYQLECYCVGSDWVFEQIPCLPSRFMYRQLRSKRRPVSQRPQWISNLTRTYIKRGGRLHFYCGNTSKSMWFVCPKSHVKTHLASISIFSLTWLWRLFLGELHKPVCAIWVNLILYVRTFGLQLWCSSSHVVPSVPGQVA